MEAVLKREAERFHREVLVRLDSQPGGEEHRWRIGIAVSVAGILTAAGLSLFFGLRGNSSPERLSIAPLARFDHLMEASRGFTTEAVVRNTGRSAVVVTDFGLLLGPPQGLTLSLGGGKPVPPAKESAREFVLQPGEGQVFYVRAPAKQVKRFLRPGTKAVFVAHTSDGRQWRSDPNTHLFYVTR
jgi:hypothetical protein